MLHGDGLQPALRAMWQTLFGSMRKSSLGAFKASEASACWSDKYSVRN